MYSTAIKDKKIKKYRSKKNKNDSSMCLLDMQLFDNDSDLELCSEYYYITDAQVFVFFLTVQ